VEDKNKANAALGQVPPAQTSSYDSGALSFEPTQLSTTTPTVQPNATSTLAPEPGFGRFVKRFSVIMVILFALGVGALLVSGWLGGDKQDAGSVAGEFNDTEIPLSDLPTDEALDFLGERSLTINGPLKVNDTFVLTPQAQPVQATAGQLYFDQTTNALAYYNGAEFVELQGNNIVSITSGSSNVSVTDDGNGNVTITSSGGGGGTGTITSSGGTAGRLAKFTGAQNIESSLLAESGTTITVNGDLNVTGAVTTATPLSVSNGGTGTNSVALNGVVIGNGTGALGTATSGGAGLCLISTAGAPSFQACPGGVTDAFVQDGNSFGATAVLGTNDGFGLNFEVNTTTVMTISTVGAVNLRNQSNSVNAFRIQNAAASADIFNVDTTNQRVGVGGAATFSKFEVIGGDAAVYDNGSDPRLILGDSTAGGENGFLMWDSTNNYMRLETTGTNGLKVNDNFVTIGNVFPDQPLKVANGTTLLAQIGTTGQAFFQNSSNSTTALNLKNAGGANMFTVDTTNSAVGINLGSTNTPSIDNGLQVNGSVHISGSGLDDFITPDGATVATDLSVEVQTLADFNQVMALGISSSSTANSRVLTVFDDRAGAHQPSIAVISPNENEIGGFSWDGTSTDFLVKNSAASGAIGLNIGGNTKLQANVSDVTITSGNEFIVQGGRTFLTGNNLSPGLRVSNGNTGTGDIAYFNDNAFTVFGLVDGGSARFQNSSNSNAGFVVNVASGAYSLLIVDTQDGDVEIGTAGAFTGKAVFGHSGGNDITLTGPVAALGASRTVRFGDETGTICLQTSSNCGFSTGSGSAFVQGGNTFGATATLGTNDANDLAFERNNATIATVGASNVTLASNIDLVLQGATAYITNSQGQTNAEAFGLSATVSTDNALAVGNAAGATSDGAVAIGRNAFGQGIGSVSIGIDSHAANSGSIALGASTLTTANNQLVIGADDYNGTPAHISHVVIGSGVTDATPTGFTLQGTSGSGSNIAGASVTFAGGQSTGNANGGSLNFQVSAPSGSGSSLNSLATTASISGASGAVTFQNLTDSTTGFRILASNASFGSGTPLFVVDSTNSRAYIGNPSSDTTGALLVLDTKSSSGDPTGVLGAMYYNSNSGKMRCFELSNDSTGYWHDCIPSARTEYYAYSDLSGNSATDLDITTFSNSGESFTPAAGVAGHPGIVNISVDTVGSDSMIVANGNSTTVLLGGGDTWRYETDLRIPTVSTGSQQFETRAGFVDSVDPADTTVDGCYFHQREDINGGEWQGVCSDTGGGGGGTSNCDTNQGVVASTWYRLTVVVNSDGTSADFQINGTSRCTISANIPDTAGLETSFLTGVWKTVGSTTRSVGVDYVEVRGLLGSSR
jgi:hypothetical protein